MQVDRVAFEAFLSKAREIDRERWHHDYSHVGMCDATGLLSLEDGREGRWLLRPGGLCRLDWSDGASTYLVVP